MTEIGPLDPAMLPPGVRARMVDTTAGLRMHVLEAGTPGQPAILLLHGFPELAWSWRAVLPGLAAAGFHVIAPDQRGYGRTTGWSAEYEGDIAPFRMFNLVRDAMALLAALGLRSVGVAGHDFGSPVAAWCALLRPDIFRAVTLMSAPFPPPPGLRAPAHDPIHDDLAALPRPRKHYQWYYSTPEANPEMSHPPGGLAAFLLAYFHMKSADWPENHPHLLPGWTAASLATLPTYYIMDRDQGMAATVAPHLPQAAPSWLPAADLAVYAAEFGRTGFQGGLNWYRCTTSPVVAAEGQLMAGRRIDVPAQFIAGASDWGVYQVPGAFERMQREACTDLRGCHLVQGAGHWVQQEQPRAVIRLLTGFFAETLR